MVTSSGMWRSVSWRKFSNDPVYSAASILRDIEAACVPECRAGKIRVRNTCHERKQFRERAQWRRWDQEVLCQSNRGRDCIVSSFFHAACFDLLKLLTPWSRVLFEKLTGSQLVKKFPAFHGTRRFITAFTTAPPPFPILTQIDRVHAPTSHFLKIHLILSSHLRLGLPSGLYSSGFPTKTLYTPLLSPIRAPPIASFQLPLPP